MIYTREIDFGGGMQRILASPRLFLGEFGELLSDEEAKSRRGDNTT